MEKYKVNYSRLQKNILILTMAWGIIYYSWWFQFYNAGNLFLYSLLFLGETYHILMAFLFWHTVWPKRNRSKPVSLSAYSSGQATVAILIPVVSEPVSVVEQTILHAKAVNYKNKNIYILNDGYVAGNINWQDYEILAERLNIKIITRRLSGGAKAGNINHALTKLKEEYLAIFDADMKPREDFLEKTMLYFADKNVAFVQTPQYYENYSDNQVTMGAWEQQDFFFGPIMVGKNHYNASFLCGTNFVIRKNTLEDIGGFNEKNIAEDFITSLKIHQQGWRSVYVPEVLASGYAPFDLGAYYKQQLRWARGSLEVLLLHNPLFMRNLTAAQKLQYFSSALFYFNGVIVVIDMMIPLIFLFFGLQPVGVSTTQFSLYFIPYILLSLYNIFQVSDHTITFRSFSFSQASFYLQLVALWSILTGKKMGFVVTDKEQKAGNYLGLCLPHLTYIVVALVAITWGYFNRGLNPAYIANVAWVLFNSVLFVPFILSSINWGKSVSPTKSFQPSLT